MLLQKDKLKIITAAAFAGCAVFVYFKIVSAYTWEEPPCDPPGCSAWQEPTQDPPGGNRPPPVYKQAEPQKGPLNIKGGSGIGKIETESICLCDGAYCGVTPNEGECISSWDDVQGLWRTGSGAYVDDIYYNTGRVGIGTASPNLPLTIADNTWGGTAVYPLLNLRRQYGDGVQFGVYVGEFTTDSYGFTISQRLQGQLSGTTETFRIDNAGKIGIGTAPSEKLEISDTTSETARLRITDTSQNPELQLQYGAGGSDHWALYNSQTNDDLRIWGGGADRVTVLQNGNVGIGTTAPAYKLSVNGEISANNLYKLLPHNIISNSFMNQIEGNVPDGFVTSSYQAPNSTISIEAAHPFTKCFEGPYTSSAPNPHAAACNEATEASPYWFGVYNKGSRANRGGLAGGWGGLTDGHILKITGNRNSADYNVYVKFPKEKRSLTKKLLFRGWVKIIQGSAAFGTDQGKAPAITRAMTEAATDGWYQINELISSSHLTDINMEHSFIFKCYGEGAGNGGNFEIYLALPYLANVEEDDSPHWSPSVLDILNDYGITKDLNSGNVGIGTTNPTVKLEVNGAIKATSIDAGALIGTVSAGNVSNGAFGSGAGNGHYGFPSRLSVGYGSGSTPTSIGQTGDLSVSGNVGIGTAGPGEKLHLIGNQLISASGDTNDPSQNLTVAGSTFANEAYIATRTNLMVNTSYYGTDFTGWNNQTSATLTRSNPTPGQGFKGTVLKWVATQAIDRDWASGGAQTSAFVLNRTYRISFQYTATNSFELHDRDSNIVTVPANTGNAKYYSTTYTKTVDTWGSPYFLVYFTGANTVQMDQLVIQDLTSGTPTYTLAADATGNVGIGTAGPEVKLDISGGDVLIDNNQYLKWERAAGGNDALSIGVASDNKARISTAAGNSLTLAADDNGINFQTYVGGWQDRMVIQEAGNVGIGTATPVAKLQVIKQGETVNQILNVLSIGKSGTGAWASGSGVGLVFGQGYTDSGAVSYFSRIVSKMYTSATDYSSLHFQTKVDGETAPSDKMVISNTGNVGIGTSGPSRKLEVADTGTTDRDAIRTTRETHSAGIGVDRNGTYWGTGIYQDGVERFVIDSNYGVLIGQNYLGNNPPNNGLLVEGNVGIGTTAPGNARLNVKGATSDSTTWGLWSANSGGTQLFGVRNDGNIGIGTTAPGAKLHVFGAYSGVFGNDGMLKIKSVDNGGCCGTEAITLQTSIDNRTDDYDISAYGGHSRHILSLQPQGGNVGIGTTTPSVKLEVDGAIKATSIDGGTMTGTVQARNVSNGPFGETGGGQYGFPAKLSIGYGIGSTPITIGQTGDLSVSGNVGIGTVAPDVLLHIHEAADTDANLYLTSDYARQNAIWLANDYDGTPNYVGLGMSTGGDMLFSTNGSLSNVPFVLKKTSGNVGIGTANPTQKLDVNGGIRVGAFSYGQANSGNAWFGRASDREDGTFTIQLGGDSAAGTKFEIVDRAWTKVISSISGEAPGGSFYVASNGNVIMNGGNVGIGTTSPSALLSVKGAGTGAGRAFVISDSMNTERVTVLDNGNVGISGDLSVGGAFSASGADVAEEFTTEEEIEEGTVVIMGDDGYKSAKPCEMEYDTKVIGVVSDNAAIIMGKVENEHKAVVAITGVVTVKVSIKNGVISKGDLLTTSDAKGYAMKAVDPKIGTVIGKALEECASDRCEIKALINLQ